MTTLFFLFSLLCAWLSYNLYQPIYKYKLGALISCAAGLVTAELACHLIAIEIVIALVFIVVGAAAGLTGLLSLLLLVAAWIGMLFHYSQSTSAAQVMEKSLLTGLGEHYKKGILPELVAQFPHHIEVKRIIRPWFSLRNAPVECLKDIGYARVNGLNLRLDIRRHPDLPKNCPVLFQLHGGGWMHKMGSKNRQALPLMNHMAERGWICVAVEYRLSPLATFPDHLIDCKRALAWVKENIAHYGGNPDFIVATGGSAGGHLCSLLALTANHGDLQPGFEAADTQVQGCVPFYGIYDFSDINRLQVNNGLRQLLEKLVVKAPKNENLALYQSASPMHNLHQHAPPFLIIQGDRDTLVSVAESRYFADKLRQISKNAVVYAEILGAQHAFDLFPSLRSELVVHGVERFLAWVYSQYVQRKDKTTT